MDGSTELKGHELFRSLSIQAVHKISQISEVEEFKAGDTIYHQNQEAKNLYILLEGLVALRFPAKEEAFSVSVIRIEKDDWIGAGTCLVQPNILLMPIVSRIPKFLLSVRKNCAKFLKKTGLLVMT